MMKLSDVSKRNPRMSDVPASNSCDLDQRNLIDVNINQVMIPDPRIANTRNGPEYG